MYVVNKADRDGADQVRRDLRSMIALADRPDDGWKPPIVATITTIAISARLTCAAWAVATVYPLPLGALPAPS